MYDVHRFRAEHGIEMSRNLFDDEATRLSIGQWGGKEWVRVEQAGPAFTLARRGQPVLCSGVTWRHHGCWMAWMIRTVDLAGLDMLPVHRHTLTFLDDFQNDDPDRRRIEMSVLESFMAGKRWAKMLGFEQEGLMKSYDPAGRDHYLYARVRSN